MKKKVAAKPKSKPVKKVAAKFAPRTGLWHSPDRLCGKTPGHDGVTTDPAKVNCVACLKLRAGSFDSRTGREECPHGTAIWVRCEKCAAERVEPPSDFRRMPQGESTAWGPIEKCPCGQMGARRGARFWPGVTFFVHTLERTSAGRLRCGRLHIVDAQGTIIEREESSRVRPELAIATSENSDSKGSAGRAQSGLRGKARRVVASESRERGHHNPHAKGTANTSDFKCLNHKVCGSKTRKHARGLCYGCYVTWRREQKAA